MQHVYVHVGLILKMQAITSIHRQSIHHGFWSSRLSDFAIKGLNMRPLNPRVFSSAAICVQAARASINLLAYLPSGDFACVCESMTFSSEISCSTNFLI